MEGWQMLVGTIFSTPFPPQKCNKVVLKLFQSVCKEHTYVKGVFLLTILISVEYFFCNWLKLAISSMLSRDKKWHCLNSYSVFQFLFLLLQVLLEAQEMAVRNHNVEFKSNLHIGTFFSYFRAEKCHPTQQKVLTSRFCCFKSAEVIRG